MKPKNVYRTLFVIFGLLCAYLMHNYLTYPDRIKTFKEKSVLADGVVIGKKDSRLKYSYIYKEKKYLGEAWVRIDVYDRYRVSDKVGVHVDPNNPAESIIKEDKVYFTLRIYSMVIAIIAFFLSIGFFVVAIRLS